ncbi:hypothetical protein [Flexithrix dorotheae]|uniref:hypothetical protein n=1 Tax=Flexithrix dorotheae TaxID=70993 RepID=UPI0003812625|nr:hypothetical protein [Flexithrix dorotheae]
MATKRIFFLHQEHSNWLNQLSFCFDEIKCFQDELAYVASSLKQEKEQKMAKKYRQKFMDMLYDIDEFRYIIHLHENYLAEQAQKGQHLAFDHCEECDRIGDFEKKFERIKKDVRAFMANNLPKSKVEIH